MRDKNRLDVALSETDLDLINGMWADGDQLGSDFQPIRSLAPEELQSELARVQSVASLSKTTERILSELPKSHLSTEVEEALLDQLEDELFDALDQPGTKISEVLNADTRLTEAMTYEQYVLAQRVAKFRGLVLLVHWSPALLFDPETKTWQSRKMPRGTESDHRELEIADPIDGIVQKGALHGKDSWTSGELQQLKDYSTAELKLKLKEEAKEAVERIARKLFPELSTAESVTADQLTECFQAASNQNPSEFESMDRKLQYRDLVKAFRESGGTVELAGQAVRMDLVKPDGAASKAFRTMHAKKGVQGAKIHWGPPPLKFSHYPIDG